MPRLIDATDLRDPTQQPLVGVAIAMALDAAGRRPDCNIKPFVRAVHCDVYEPTGTVYLSVDVWYGGPELCDREFDGPGAGEPLYAAFSALYTLRCATASKPEAFTLDAD